jgi:xanthine/uracil permease
MNNTNRIVNIALGVVSLVLVLIIKELHSTHIINSGVSLALCAGVIVAFFAAKQIIRKKYPSLETELQFGGQPIYYYFLSVE